MSAIALDPLIAEAKRRARRRQLIALAIGVVSLGAVATYAAPRGGSWGDVTARVSIPAGATGVGCGVRGVGARILTPAGRTLYREPGEYDHPNRGFPTIQCSGSTVWAVWFNGVGMMRESYVGARSLDGGRTWRPVFADIGLKAPKPLDAYLGVWTLRGPRTAYFAGSCPACSDTHGPVTNALYVTRNAGRSFREYALPSLTGYSVTRIAVHGAEVTLAAKWSVRGVTPARKRVTVTVG
jgi:hypothetical protein